MALVLVLLLHAVLALVAGLAGRRLGRGVLLLTALGPAVALAYAAALTPAVIDGSIPEVSIAWAGDLDLTIDLRLDGFALLFWWVIAGVGLLVMLYANRYFGERRDLGRFASMLVLFAGSMLLLTSADNVLVLFVAWELTSITSYLLIGFEDHKAQTRAAALQALLVTAAGGLALLGGLVLIGQQAGTYSLSGILAAPPSSGVASVGLALALVGAMSKSAQAPFHFWLPGAMAAPTPVSAYLHSATMVKAGIYLIARLAPSFAPAVDWWRPTLVAVGTVTMLLGGYRALRQTDLKALLAYGTVSQLGFMALLLGVGEPELTHAGVAVLLAHAVFKAALFLTVGVVDHQAHARDLRRLDGLWRIMPATAVAMAISAASMAGVIPLLGFVAKEAALEAALHTGIAGGFVTAAIVAGAVLTTAYGIRLVWGAFAAKSDDVLIADAVDPASVEPPSRAFEAPGLLLAAASVVFGLWLAVPDALVGVASMALAPDSSELHLKLWHGIGPSFLLSLGALAVGAALFALPRLVAVVGRLTERAPDMTELYRRSLRGLNLVADWTTSLVQPGSLPIYLGMILATVVVLPGAMLLTGADLPASAALADSPLQVVVGVLVVAAALGTAVMRRRLSAVLLLGAIGYGVAVLFVIQGAPDLALTQVLIETLSLGLFVLVLRRLPVEFRQPTWRLGNGLRVALALAVGVFMSAFALIAAGGRTGGTNAADFLERAKPEGGGNNVVNVIITDMRALDTLGEITVILVAAIGILSMVGGALVRTTADDPEETS
ncbi:MAG: hydrogen gas-evolving membrane-bound hydrogenase subunit E [Acidimicrobiia bacterium]